MFLDIKQSVQKTKILQWTKQQNREGNQMGNNIITLKRKGRGREKTQNKLNYIRLYTLLGQKPIEKWPLLTFFFCHDL